MGYLMREKASCLDQQPTKCRWKKSLFPWHLNFTTYQLGRTLDHDYSRALRFKWRNRKFGTLGPRTLTTPR